MEYVILAAAIAAVIIVTVALLGVRLESIFCDATDAFGAVASCS